MRSLVCNLPNAIDTFVLLKLLIFELSLSAIISESKTKPLVFLFVLLLRKHQFWANKLIETWSESRELRWVFKESINRCHFIIHAHTRTILLLFLRKRYFWFISVRLKIINIAANEWAAEWYSRVMFSVCTKEQKVMKYATKNLYPFSSSHPYSSLSLSTHIISIFFMLPATVEKHTHMYERVKVEELT